MKIEIKSQKEMNFRQTVKAAVLIYWTIRSLIVSVPVLIRHVIVWDMNYIDILETQVRKHLKEKARMTGKAQYRLISRGLRFEAAEEKLQK